MADEGLTAQVTILRQCDLELLGQRLHHAHVDVGAGVVGSDG